MLLWTAHVAAILLWVPLSILYLAQRRSAARPTLHWLVFASLVAALYEGSMQTLTKANIRVDLLLLVPVLGLIDGIAGLAFLAEAARLRKQHKARPARAIPIDLPAKARTARARSTWSSCVAMA